MSGERLTNSRENVMKYTAISRRYLEIVARLSRLPFGRVSMDGVDCFNERERESTRRESFLHEPVGGSERSVNVSTCDARRLLVRGKEAGRGGGESSRVAKTSHCQTTPADKSVKSSLGNFIHLRVRQLAGVKARPNAAGRAL